MGLLADVRKRKQVAKDKHVAAVQDIIDHLHANIHSLSEKESKKILADLGLAMIILFVEREPKLIDPNISSDEKVMPMLKAVAGLTTECISAYMMAQSGFPESMKKIEAKFSNLKELQNSISLLTRNKDGVKSIAGGNTR